MSTRDVSDDDLLEDEPRFAYLLELELACSDLRLIFDKQHHAFLLTGENHDGVSVRLLLGPHELERVAVELLLAARDRIGRSAPVVKRAVGEAPNRGYIGGRAAA